MSTARLIIDPPVAGAWNMAVDEALLLSEGDAATLRFYGWSEATLSLGYFQSHAERSGHVASKDCAMVRRATGGGAILHDHELTYSFVAPIADRWGANAGALYDTFHDALVDTLRRFGVEAYLCETPLAHPAGKEPFLCFARRTKGDVLLGEYKIGGSAQRRHRGAILQHGSILLMQSSFAPELPGVAELAQRVLSPWELASAWYPSLAARLRLELVPGELSEAERAGAAEIEAAKFSASPWNERR